jgi:hypothetical protein
VNKTVGEDIGDTIGNSGNALSNSSINIVSDISDMVGNKSKNATDYVKGELDIAKNIACMPVVKNIYGLGGALGLASDAIKISELVNEKNTNPGYWAKAITNTVGDGLSFIPGFGQFLQQLAQFGCKIFGKLGDFFEKGYEENQQHLKDFEELYEMQARRKDWERVWKEIEIERQK